jgi:hypothetical protein
MAGKGSSHAPRINPFKYYSSDYWNSLEKNKPKTETKLNEKKKNINRKCE